MNYLNSNNEVRQIIQVYPDGRLISRAANLTPRRGDNNFSMDDRTQVIITDASDIVAVEVNEFSGYNSGDKVGLVNGLNVCGRTELELYNLPSHLRRRDFPVFGCQYGRAATEDTEGSITITIVFSDGTMVLGRTFVNPFPPNLQNYRIREEATD